MSCLGAEDEGMLGVFLRSPAQSTAPNLFIMRPQRALNMPLFCLFKSPLAFSFVFLLFKKFIIFLSKKVATGSYKCSTCYVSNATLSKWTQNNVEREKK